MTAQQFPLAQGAVGVGLKAQHYKQALETQHGANFFEVHAENFMGEGGPPHRWLSEFQARFPLSVHGVCLSIGGRDPLDQAHLERLAKLVERYRPALVSEHLAWSRDGEFFYNDLLPPPLTSASLARVCDHVSEVQDRLGRQLLIENPSQYLKPVADEISEPDFLNELALQSGCGLLLDINNVFVSACNLDFSAEAYLNQIDGGAVKQIHLAGHAIDHYGTVTIRVDNHGAPICDNVMTLFEHFVRRAGVRSTLIEWDTNIPDFETLERECAAVKKILSKVMQDGGACDAA